MLAGYLFGVVGRINQPCIGYVEEPDIDAFHYVDGPKQPTYRVTFHQKDLWEGYQVSAPPCTISRVSGFLRSGGTRADKCCSARCSHEAVFMRLTEGDYCPLKAFIPSGV